MRPSPPRVCFEVSFSVFRSPPIPPHATPSRAPPEPEVIKCLCVSLVCGLAKPLHRCGMILSKTLAVIAHRPEIILCLCASTPAAGSKCASSELTQTTAAKQRAATKSPRQRARCGRCGGQLAGAPHEGTSSISSLCVYSTAPLPSFLSWKGNRTVRLSHCQQLPGSWMAAVCGWLSVRPALQNILAYLDILSAAEKKPRLL